MVGPYVHIFRFHTIELIRKHGNINLFNTEGLEKLNQFCKEYYHQSTNQQKKNNRDIKQIICKRNRMEFFKLKGELINKNSSSENSENEDEGDNEDDQGDDENDENLSDEDEDENN